MFKTIKKYFENRQEEVDKEALEMGFGWAMTEVILNGKEIEDFAMKVDFDNHPFDTGAKKALSWLASYQDERREVAEFKPHYEALEAQVDALNPALVWHEGFVANVESQQKLLQHWLKNSPATTTLGPVLTVPEELTGINLNTTWKHLWVAQDSDGEWYEYEEEPKSDAYIFYADVCNSLLYADERVDWKNTKQQIR